MEVYYSPYGGSVQAVLDTRDDSLDLQVIQGTLARTTLDEATPLAEHVKDDKQPTQLEGWHVDASTKEVGFRQRGFTASAPAQPAFASGEVAALRSDLAELRRQLANLVLPQPIQPVTPPGG